MSEKNLDPQGRMRNKTVAFRMSPEEADLLQRYADMSGMTKQDYLISRVLQREVTVVPNKRMQLYMEETCSMSSRSSDALTRGRSCPGIYRNWSGCCLASSLPWVGKTRPRQPPTMT